MTCRTKNKEERREENRVYDDMIKLLHVRLDYKTVKYKNVDW